MVIKGLQGKASWCQREFFGNVSNPFYVLLDNIIKGNDAFPENMTYNYEFLLKISSWNEQIQKNTDFNILC